MAREAQAVPNKTPFESYMVTRLIAQAAAGAGEPGRRSEGIRRNYRFRLGRRCGAPPVCRRRGRAVLHRQGLRQGRRARGAPCQARRHGQIGAHDLRPGAVPRQQLRRRAKAISADVEAEEDAGKAPAEEQLQLMANAYLQQRDTAGYGKALEKLLTYYPSAITG